MSKTDETQLEEGDSLFKNIFTSEKLPRVKILLSMLKFVRGQIINWEHWQEVLYI